MPKFDFHVHCYPRHLARRAVSAVPTGADAQTDATWEGQLKFMAETEFKHAAILNIAASPHSMHSVNSFALEITRPDQLVFGSVHPFAENALEELDWLYENGIRGIKLHTGYQQYEFDDPAAFPVYRRIGELGMVTLIHCGPFFKNRDHVIWPQTIARAIDQFKGAPFVAAHMGGVKPDHPDFALVKEMPVYVDTALASIRMNQEQFAYAVEELGVDRVLYGTDMPWQDPRKLVAWIDEALASKPQEYRDKIYCRNAMELCRKLMPENSFFCLDE